MIVICMIVAVISVIVRAVGVVMIMLVVGSVIGMVIILTTVVAVVIGATSKVDVDRRRSLSNRRPWGATTREAPRVVQSHTSQSRPENVGS